MILVIDNYDSFVYNLAQYLGELGYEPRVFRNDNISVEEARSLKPSHIVLSPGPCTPLQAGISNDIILSFAGEIPILGVCLGHQCIGHVFGGVVDRGREPVHGKSSRVWHDGRTIYNSVSNPFEAGRYHSLVIKHESFPACLEISARTENGEIMGVRHRHFAVEGIQVHPESILTEAGHTLLANFLGINMPVWE